MADNQMAKLCNSVILTPEQAIATTLGCEDSGADGALALLDEIREADRISYDDYSRLHDAIAVTLGSERIYELQAEIDDLEGKIRDLCVAEDEDRAIYEAHIAALEELIWNLWQGHSCRAGCVMYDECPICGKEA